MEKLAQWYDQSFEKYQHWKNHYSRSRYYSLWRAIVGIMIINNTRSILEVGCGAGQLAHLIEDVGFADYTGFDFSPKRIEHARKTCPSLTFYIDDVYDTNLFYVVDYDTVVMTEFLEHVNGDLDVLHKIKAGAFILATVPNFPYESHVRHFTKINDVIARYGDHISNLEVYPQGARHYLISGLGKAQ